MWLSQKELNMGHFKGYTFRGNVTQNVKVIQFFLPLAAFTIKKTFGFQQLFYAESGVAYSETVA